MYCFHNVVNDNQVILRILEICREHNIDDNIDVVIRFARISLPQSAIIDHGFADAFQDSVIEAIEEEKEERLNKMQSKDADAKDDNTDEISDTGNNKNEISKDDENFKKPQQIQVCYCV